MQNTDGTKGWNSYTSHRDRNQDDNDEDEAEEDADSHDFFECYHLHSNPIEKQEISTYYQEHEIVYVRNHKKL